MTKHLHTIVFAALVISLGVSDVRAQTQPQPQTQTPSQPAGPRGAVTPLKVQVVISRYQGEKKIGSVPYTLAVNAYSGPPFPGQRPAQLKMGSMVPLMSPTTVKGKSTSEGLPDGYNVSSYNYQNIGTQIDCSAVPSGEGRFELNISIEDSSIYVDDQVVKGAAKGNDPPIFRSFRSRNDLILRDGQSIQYTAATDRISGETIRIDVTLSVLK